MEAINGPTERRRKTKAEVEAPPATDAQAAEAAPIVIDAEQMPDAIEATEQLALEVVSESAITTMAPSESAVEELPSSDTVAAAVAPVATSDATQASVATEIAEASEASEQPDAGTPADLASPADAGELDDLNGGRLDRRRIEEQLDALKRKESELRRALAMADHPELADAIRFIEGCAYAVARVDAKMAQGLSKSEERRRETLDKKLSSLREKRAELDAQIAELAGELSQLVDERARAFELERREALERLLAALGTHDAELHAAGLDPSTLVPDIARFMPEVKALAETLVAAHADLG